MVLYLCALTLKYMALYVCTIVHVFHGMAIYVTRWDEVYPYLMCHSCKSCNRRTNENFSILFFSVLHVSDCVWSICIPLGHESYHSEMSLSWCTVLYVTGGCGRFRPAHTSVFFPCGEWQDIAHASFLTWSTIFSNVFRLTYSYLCTYDLYSLVHNVLDACIRGEVGRGLSERAGA
jgi:hypothetical protein